jgi:hypothetical protein
MSLTAEQVIAIRFLVATGQSMRSVAKEYGVTHDVVRYIVDKRRTH